MTLNDVSTLISTVGFPICMCGAMFWYMIKQNDAHKEETNAMKDVINELKIAITQLTDSLKEN